MADLLPARGPGGSVRLLPLRARFSLRCGAEALPTVGAALGVLPPVAPLTSAVQGPRAALWLGPDEWLLLAEEGAVLPVLTVLHALVDVSDRHHAFAVEGPQAATLLNEGCPLDLDPTAFPPGACTRTLFGKVEIVLWRRDAEAFEVEVARSFAAPLHALLAEALADLDAIPAMDGGPSR